MNKRIRLTKFVNIFGFVYFVLNLILFIVMCIFAVHAKIETDMSPGIIVFLFPLIGVFTGYWMRTGKYGWWRSILIVISLLASLILLFMAVFVFPEIKAINQKEFKLKATLKTIDQNSRQLFKAVSTDDIEMVRRLLESGAYPNPRNDTGQTPLHVAQHQDIVRELIAKGAKVNAFDGDGFTPIFNKEIKSIKILVEAGADINIKSLNRGNTPMIWYSYSGYIDGVRYLISLEAEINVKNADNQTACDIAEKFGHFELSAYLKSVGAKPE